MFNKLIGIFGGARSKLSRLELFFLSKFDGPTNPAEISGYLRATVQQDPVRLAKKFLEAGLIEDALEIRSLLASATQATLKQALKDSGLKVSGKKEELGRRLLENDYGLARKLIRGPHFDLSPKGRDIVHAFQVTEKAASEQYAAEWIRCFDSRDLKGVLAAHRAYSDWAIKPPASFNPIAISLPDYRIIEMYQAIIYARPGILGEISSLHLCYLQRCAAWDWAGAGDGGSLRFAVPSDFQCALEAQVAARMVSFAARHNVEIEGFKKLGIKKVKILGCGAGSCDHCRSIDGKMFNLSKVPELPHPQCTHQMGCRCIANAEIDFS